MFTDFAEIYYFTPTRLFTCRYFHVESSISLHAAFPKNSKSQRSLIFPADVNVCFFLNKFTDHRENVNKKVVKLKGGQNLKLQKRIEFKHEI